MCPLSYKKIENEYFIYVLKQMEHRLQGERLGDLNQKKQ
jgi:hypothetical protein